MIRALVPSGRLRAAAALLLTGLFLAVGPVGSLPSASAAGTGDPFTTMVGVRWKAPLAVRDELANTTPYVPYDECLHEGGDAASCAGLPTLEQTIAQLTANGVTTATIDVTPYHKVWNTLFHANQPGGDGLNSGVTGCGQTDPTPYGQVAPAPTLSCDNAIWTWKNKQFDDIVAFVQRVAAITPTPSLQFILSARVEGGVINWTDTTAQPNKTTGYAQDMDTTINRLTAPGVGLGSWIKGISIGEHQISDPHAYLPLGSQIIAKINTDTGGFLANGKAAILNGGDFGANFNGIADAATTSFYNGIKSSYFSFAFKFYNNTDGPTNDWVMPADTVDAWKTFLSNVNDKSSPSYQDPLNGLHLNALRTAVAAAPSASLQHAIFVGDSADGVSAAFRQWGCPALTAANSVFQTGFGFRGFLFGEPYDARDRGETDVKALNGMWSDTTGAAQRPLTTWSEWKGGNAPC